MTRNKPELQLFTGSPLFCREEEWKPKESELRLSLFEVAASVSLTAAVFSANSVRTSSEQTKTKIKISFIVLKGSTQLAYVPLRGITARLQCCLEQVVMSQFRLHIYYILVIVRVKQCGSLYFGTYTSTEITRQKSLLIHFRDLVHCRKDSLKSRMDWAFGRQLWKFEDNTVFFPASLLHRGSHWIYSNKYTNNKNIVSACTLLRKRVYSVTRQIIN